MQSHDIMKVLSKRNSVIFMFREDFFLDFLFIYRKFFLLFFSGRDNTHIQYVSLLNLRQQKAVSLMLF